MAESDLCGLQGCSAPLGRNARFCSRACANIHARTVTPKDAWTEDELEVLRTRYGIESVDSLSERLGRSVRAIRVKANRMRLHRSKEGAWSHAEKVRVSTLTSEGYSRNKIAKLVKRTPGDVAALQERQRNELLLDGMTLKQVKSDLGLSRDTLSAAMDSGALGFSRTSRGIVFETKQLQAWIKADPTVILLMKNFSPRSLVEVLSAK